jgi:probable biosynthetic protein (TIGR04098 family)
MSSLTTFLHKQRMRWYGRGIDRAHHTRRRLAYYVAEHGFEIGDYSVGNPSVRLYDVSRLVIGRYCSISAGALLILGGNHRTDIITTSYLELPLPGIGPNDPHRTRGDIVVGSDVWIAGNAIITSGVTIGDGAVVGAGSVVLHDVPPYSIVFGNPARVMQKRFSDDDIDALLSLRWWDLSREEVLSLRPLLFGSDVGALIAAVRALKGLPAQPQRPPEKKVEAGRVPAPPTTAVSDDNVLALVRRVFPAISLADLDAPLDRLDVDSFGMITLRTELEQEIGCEITDAAWTSIETLRDILHVAGAALARETPAATTQAVIEHRAQRLNMPQMAQSGLSEAWLFKELGDIHWELITRGLKTPSSELKDAAGDRLYATFTRFQLDSNAPMAAYRENEAITIDARISRYGAGMFFNDVTVQGDGKAASLRIMSSFSKFGARGANTSLLKGQPDVPPDCPIPVLAELPAFARDYRERRGSALAPPLFTTEYEIVPVHDINGVGLLYFAAYPVIDDICAARYAGRDAFGQLSTTTRDVCYFANCDPHERLIYRLHRFEPDGDQVVLDASLSRKSDDALMARIVTRKGRLPA